MFKLITIITLITSNEIGNEIINISGVKKNIYLNELN
jgi:hypothetical protein